MKPEHTKDGSVRVANEDVSRMDYKKAHMNNGVKIISKKDIDDTLQYATSLKRAREPILIHEHFDEIPQRFVNCLDPKTYVRPHMHVVPSQWELMCWLSGEIIALLFDDYGKVTGKILMNEDNVRIIEIPPFCYHTFIAIGYGAYLEVRNCKYQPSVDRLYSAWSPEENSAQAKEYQSRLCIAEVGDLLTSETR